jgi:excisionase family DNA binding protein
VGQAREQQVGAPMPAGVGPKDLLRVWEVALWLQVSKMTVYRMIHDGELPAARVGKRNLRVPRAAVLALLPGAEQ